MKTDSPVSADDILILSPSSAPPLFGDDGSIAKTATFSPLLTHSSIMTPINVDLPTPGGPVTPKTHDSLDSSIGNLSPDSIIVNNLASSLLFPCLARTIFLS